MLCFPRFAVCESDMCCDGLAIRPRMMHRALASVHATCPAFTRLPSLPLCRSLSSIYLNFCRPWMTRELHSHPHCVRYSNSSISLHLYHGRRYEHTNISNYSKAANTGKLIMLWRGLLALCSRHIRLFIWFWIMVHAAAIIAVIWIFR